LFQARLGFSVGGRDDTKAETDQTGAELFIVDALNSAASAAGADGHKPEKR